MRLVFSFVRSSAVAVLSARGYHALLFNHFAMRQSFSSVLAATLVYSIGGKPFLTRRSSGSAHKAAPTAELIR